MIWHGVPTNGLVNDSLWTPPCQFSKLGEARSIKQDLSAMISETTHELTTGLSREWLAAHIKKSGLLQRQRELKNGSSAGAISSGNRSAVELNDSAADRQADTGT